MNDSTLVALANHWLVTYRGGERVLEEFRKLFPYASMATLVVKRGEIPDGIIGRRVSTSFIQWIPFGWRFYKALLPLHSLAFSRLTVAPGTIFVLSSDASMIKGLRLPQGCKQVCYCHSPPRYLWDMAEDYVASMGFGARLVFRWTQPKAKKFDLKSAERVDQFIANSKFVANRIKFYYGRDSVVIYPPVSVHDFSPDRKSDDFYLIVGQITPYKRVDIAVKAFAKSGRRLVVIGEGSEMEALRAIAGPNVQFLGRQPFSVVKDHFERCRAFLYPQTEDFGITAVEAQAAGKPVIAFRNGGALETVIDGKTGLFFDEQNDISMNEAIGRFEMVDSTHWASNCRLNAESFKPEIFRKKMRDFLTKSYPCIFSDYIWPIEIKTTE